MKINMHITAISIILLMIICEVLQAGTDGLFYSEYDTTIQDMIDEAEEGDTVLVAPGTYTGDGNRDLNFQGKNIVLLSVDGPSETVLDCEFSACGFYFTQGEDISSIVDGFTIVSPNIGLIIDNSSPLILECNVLYGASAINCSDGQLNVQNCSFDMGGPSFLMSPVGIGNSYFNISNCTVIDNTTTCTGGGLHISNSEGYITDCIISGNYVEEWNGYAQGGGIYSYESDIIIERCQISDNICENVLFSSVEGGGIFCEYGSVIISDCLISDNLAEYGGGLYLFGMDYWSVTDCDIIRNRTYTGGSGGGVSILSASPDYPFSGCLISGNRSNRGAGFFCSNPQGFEISNCTIVYNTATEGGGIACIQDHPTVFTNCIAYNNSPNDFLLEECGEAIVNWTDIEGGWPGEGNIDEEPMFVAPEYGDYRLLWGSPCIDSGNPDSLDLDGTRSDMGAHSFDQSKELIVYLSPETNEIALGETGCVKCTICNSKRHEKNFGTAAGVRCPDGSPWPGNPLEDAFYSSIPPSSNLTREIEYRVPLGWLSGTYSLAAGVGYNGKIYDLDHFEFTVVE